MIDQALKIILLLNPQREVTFIIIFIESLQIEIFFLWLTNQLIDQIIKREFIKAIISKSKN